MGDLSLGGGSSRGGILLGGCRGLLISRGVDVLILLSGAVDSDLDSDDAAINVLAVHLGNSLVLEFLRGKVDETETASLATLVTGLQLLDHETGDRTQSNLGGDGLVSGKDFLQLWENKQAKSVYGGLGLIWGERGTDLVLGQVVGKVSNHDLGLGSDSILGRTTLLLGTGSTRLASVGTSILVVGSVGERGFTGGNLGGFLVILGLFDSQ